MWSLGGECPKTKLSRKKHVTCVCQIRFVSTNKSETLVSHMTYVATCVFGNDSQYLKKKKGKL